MADIVPDNVYKQFDGLLVLPGERIRIQILNSDGTQKTLVCDDSAPTGKQMNPTIASYTGSLVDHP